MDETHQTVMMLVLDNGKCPVEEWLSGFRDKVTRARITRQIDKLGRGNVGVRRSVGESVSELKLDFGPGYRVYYARMDKVTLVLLGGGDKSDQTSDIERAQRLWKTVEEQGLADGELAPWTEEEADSPASEDVKPQQSEPGRKETNSETKEL